MATYAQPGSWAGIEAGGELYYAYSLETGEGLVRLAETTDPLALGLLMMIGEPIGGIGSDTYRVMDRVSPWALTLSTLASETDRPTAASVTLGYTDFTIGRYGGARQETYDAQIFNLPGVQRALSPVQYMAESPFMAVAKARSLAVAAGAGIAASVGGAVATSLDTMIAAAVAFDANGYDAPFGQRPVMWLHPDQIANIKASARTEPGFQNSGDFSNIQGLQLSSYIENFLGLDFDVVRTADIGTSGGARQGFAVDRGGIGVCTADTARIQAPAGVRTYFVPALGLHVQEIDDSAGQAVTEMQVRVWMGATMGSTSVFRQRRVLGT